MILTFSTPPLSHDILNDINYLCISLPEVICGYLNMYSGTDEVARENFFVDYAQSYNFEILGPMTDDQVADVLVRVIEVLRKMFKELDVWLFNHHHRDVLRMQQYYPVSAPNGYIFIKSKPHVPQPQHFR